MTLEEFTQPTHGLAPRALAAVVSPAALASRGRMYWILQADLVPVHLLAAGPGAVNARATGGLRPHRSAAEQTGTRFGHGAIIPDVSGAAKFRYETHFFLCYNGVIGLLTDQQLAACERFASGPSDAYSDHFARAAVGMLLAEYRRLKARADGHHDDDPEFWDARYDMGEPVA